MSIRKTLVTVALVAMVIAFTLGYTDVLNADPRLETNDGFCHFQIDRNNANNEVFAANCEHDIYVDHNGQAFGYAIETRRYPRGRTPIGNVRALLQQRNDRRQRPPGRCRFILPYPDYPVTIPPPGKVGSPEELLCRLRITGETANNQNCNLVDSNGTQYATRFWTGVYTLFADGTIEYQLDCREADQQ